MCVASCIIEDHMMHEVRHRIGGRMIVPGILISIVTFPGVMVHELAHQIFCRLMRVPVYDVVYFQPKNPCGYVSHEPAVNPWKVFLISVGPFLVNTLLGVLVVFPAAIELMEFKYYNNILNLLLGWIGFSILMHAFPSTGDAKVMIQCIWKNSDVSVLAKIVLAPVIGLIYVGALGSMFWLDFIYAGFMAMVVPNLLIGLL